MNTLHALTLVRQSSFRPAPALRPQPEPGAVSGLGPRAANHSFSEGWRSVAATSPTDLQLPETVEDRARYLHDFAVRQQAEVKAGRQDDAQAVRSTLRHAASLANGDADEFAQLAANVLVDLAQVPEPFRGIALDQEEPNRFHVPFGDTGFQERLRDTDGNLVHHMGFYFVAGYLAQRTAGEHGSMIGLGGVAAHELEPLLASGRNANLLPDLRSGHAGISMGRWLAHHPERLDQVDRLWQVNTMEERP